MRMITSEIMMNTYCGKWIGLRMKVPFFSFKMAPQELKDKWLQATTNVINEGIFIQGVSLELFENNWAEMNETQYAIGVGNGFDGLVIALRALGVGVGDKVAVPAHTFFACWLAIHEVGAIPVGIEVDDNGLLCLDSLESLNTNIRAVMPVHMHGAMVDMQRLCKLAKNAGVSIIEDASLAIILDPLSSDVCPSNASGSSSITCCCT